MIRKLKHHLGLTGILALGVCGCATHGPDHYRANGVYQTFEFSRSDDYQHYREEVRRDLTANWQNLFATDENYEGKDAAMVPAIVEQLVPTDGDPINPPGAANPKRSMLLLHGLFDSPYVMHDLEQFFQKQGFHTRSLLLPGHGTRPGNLLKIDREEWIKAVEFGVNSLHRDIGGDVYITGYSTGGALALRQALVYPDSVSGLFLFAPAIEVPSQASQHLFKFLGFKWMPFQKLADRDYASYESATLAASIEVSRLGNEIQALLEDRPLKIPTMIVAAENDYTIKTEVTRELFEDGRFGERSRMFIYSPLDGRGKPREETGSVPTAGKKQQYRVVELPSRFRYTMAGKSYQIADYSHRALTLRPDDPHYGLEGDYQYCHHYFLWPGSARNRDRCSSGTNRDVCFGERKMIGAISYSVCQGGHVVRRLTSNPGFDRLEREMSRFIGQHISPTGSSGRAR